MIIKEQVINNKVYPTQSNIFNIVLFPPNHPHELPQSETRYMTYVWVICEDDNVNLSSRVEE